MAKTKKFKRELLKEYTEMIQSAKAMVVLRAKGVTPNESNQLKREIFDQGSEYHVIKNTVFRIALQEANLSNEEVISEGEHAVVFMKDDIVTPSKALKAFMENVKDSESNSKAQIAFGFLDGSYLTGEQVSELAEMPDIQGSISMILGILDQAMSGVVNVLEDAPRSFVTILDQAFTE